MTCVLMKALVIGVKSFFRIVRIGFVGELVERQRLVGQQADGVAVVAAPSPKADRRCSCRRLRGSRLRQSVAQAAVAAFLAERAHENIAGAADAVGGEDSDRLVRDGRLGLRRCRSRD